MYTKLEDIKKGDKFIIAGTMSYNEVTSGHDVSFPVVADNDAEEDEEGLVFITYDEGVCKFVASPDYLVWLECREEVKNK